MKTTVLDASAMLAMFFGEPGMDRRNLTEVIGVSRLLPT